MSPRWVSPPSPSLVYMRVRLTVMVRSGVGVGSGGRDRPSGGGKDPEPRARPRPGWLPGAVVEPRHDACAGRREGDRVRDGGDTAHLARTVDGRALLAEQRRRLQGGAA